MNKESRIGSYSRCGEHAAQCREFASAQCVSALTQRVCSVYRYGTLIYIKIAQYVYYPIKVEGPPTSMAADP